MQPPPPPQGGHSAPLQAIFDEFEAYPFSDDPDFKAGLPTVVAAIRAKERTAAQIDEMIGRAQWFYFTRIKNLQIPWEAYAQYSQSQIQTYPTANQSGTISLSSPPGQRPGATSTARPSDPLAQLNNLAEARRMMSSLPGREGGEEGMSFAMLCRLISEGRAGEVAQAQREGEGMVVDAINTASPSISTLSTRPKPWQTMNSLKEKQIGGLNDSFIPEQKFTYKGSPYDFRLPESMNPSNRSSSHSPRTKHESRSSQHTSNFQQAQNNEHNQHSGQSSNSQKIQSQHFNRPNHHSSSLNSHTPELVNQVVHPSRSSPPNPLPPSPPQSYPFNISSTAPTYPHTSGQYDNGGISSMSDSHPHRSGFFPTDRTHQTEVETSEQYDIPLIFDPTYLPETGIVAGRYRDRERGQMLNPRRVSETGQALKQEEDRGMSWSPPAMMPYGWAPPPKSSRSN